MFRECGAGLVLFAQIQKHDPPPPSTRTHLSTDGLGYVDDGQDDYSEEDRDRADEAEEEGAARKRGRNSDAAKARKRRAILFGGQANKVTSMFLRPAAPLLAPAKPGKDGAAGAGGADAASAPAATPAMDDFESLIGDLDKPSAPSRWGGGGGGGLPPTRATHTHTLSLSPPPSLRE